MLGCLQIYPLFSGHTCAACVCGTNFAHCSLFAFVLGQAYIIFSMLPQASGIEATDLDGGGFFSDDGASEANDHDGGGFSSDGDQEAVVGPSQHSPARSRSRSREVARVLVDSAPVSRAPKLPAPVVKQIDVHTVPPLIPSMELWQKPLLEALQPRREYMLSHYWLTRRMTHESAFSGNLTELYAFQVDQHCASFTFLILCMWHARDTSAIGF